LTQAISYMINRAPHGCTARNLIDKLHVPCHALFSTMYKAGRIDRIKSTNEYSYLSVDKIVNKRYRESLDKAAQPLSKEAAVPCEMVYIGRALFLRHRSNRELIDELAVKNIRINPSEIDYLGRKFIIYVALAHFTHNRYFSTLEELIEIVFNKFESCYKLNETNRRLCAIN